MSTQRRILVVDHSKVVRATLAKHLGNSFDIREEENGESAWQTLVLDSSIVAVICGTQIPKMSAYELLERLRINKLRRLSDIPFFLVVSGSETEADRRLAMDKGVTDFITRGMSKGDIQGQVRRLLEWEFMIPAEQASQPNAGGKIRTAEAEEVLLPRSELVARLASILAAQSRDVAMVSVIKFGVDNHQALAERYGPEAVSRIAERLAHIIRSKIGRNDLIGYGSPSQCLIVSPDTSMATCVAFAQRVCRGFSSGQIVYRGEPISLTISAGVANVPVDGVLDAEALVNLAANRLLRASTDGGGRVIHEEETVNQSQMDAAGKFALAEFLKALCSPIHLPNPGTIGLQLMPLLTVLDNECKLGLPLSEIARRFDQCARQETC